jgi:hypothetical protein
MSFSYLMSNGLGGELSGHLRPHPTKSHKSMEIEERYIIKFFADEGMQEGNTVKHFNEYNGHDVLS